MPAIPTIIECVTDPQLLGLEISPAQCTLLKSIYGLPLDQVEHAIFCACTGRQTYTGQPFSEVTVVAGARSGKDSRIAAPIVVYEAVFGQHARHLARGERGVIALVAQDARAARIAFGYIREYFTRSPLLSSLVDEVLANEIVLKNGISIVCFPSTMRSMRGFTLLVAVLDELAYYRLEGQADSDVEIQASARRGMIGVPNSKLVKISTPYMRSGVLHDDFKRAFAVDDPDLLVCRAPTTLMNPTITPERLERERRLDPVRFSREYEAEFAEDVDAFLPSAWIESAIEIGRHELPPQSGLGYIGAIDASGGGKDAFTFAIVHAEGTGATRKIVQDVMRGWSKPREGSTSLEGAVQQIATLAKSYGISRIIGDRYARGWVREAFRRHGITYIDAALRDQSGDPQYLDRSAAYLDIEPLFAMGMIEILDHPQLVRELKLLERRPQAGGKDRVDHPRGLHDDFANALALAAAKARQGGVRPLVHVPSDGGPARIGERIGERRAPDGQVSRAIAGVMGGQAFHLTRSRWYR